MKKTLLATLVAFAATALVPAAQAVTVYKSADEKTTVSAGVDVRVFNDLTVKTQLDSTTDKVVKKESDASTSWKTTLAPRLNLTVSHKLDDKVTVAFVTRGQGAASVGYSNDKVSYTASVPSSPYYYGYLKSTDFGTLKYGKYYHEAYANESTGYGVYSTVGSASDTLLSTPSFYVGYALPTLGGVDASVGYGTHKPVGADKVKVDTYSTAVSYSVNGHSLGLVANYDQEYKDKTKQKGLVSGAVSYETAKLDEATGLKVALGGAAKNKVETSAYAQAQSVYAGVKVDKLEGVQGLAGLWVNVGYVNSKEGSAKLDESAKTYTVETTKTQTVQAVVGAQFDVYKNNGVTVRLYPEYSLSADVSNSTNKYVLKYDEAKVTTTDTTKTGGVTSVGKVTLRVTY